MVNMPKTNIELYKSELVFIFQLLDGSEQLVNRFGMPVPKSYHALKNKIVEAIRSAPEEN